MKNQILTEVVIEHLDKTRAVNSKVLTNLLREAGVKVSRIFEGRKNGRPSWYIKASIGNDKFEGSTRKKYDSWLFTCFVFKNLPVINNEKPWHFYQK